MHLTIVVPVKDEQDSVPVLSEEILSVMKDVSYAWECIWVDDGSTDASLSVIKSLCTSVSNYRYIQFDGNFGQSAAVVAGIKSAQGALIGTLDSDLQNDPVDIVKMVKVLDDNPNVHCVNGFRQKRNDSIVRRVSSRVGNGFKNWVTMEALRDVGCATRVFHKKCIENMFVFRGSHKFIPSVISMNGYTMMEIPVNHRPRSYGKAKYGIFNRLFVGMYDCIAIRWMKKRGVTYRIKHVS